VDSPADATPETDELLHLKVPTVFLREKLEGLVVRNRASARRIEPGTERRQGLVFDMRPAGAGVASRRNAKGCSLA
jgi:hypothetical protein